MVDYYTIDTQFGKNIVVNTKDGTFVIVKKENTDICWTPIRRNYQEVDAKYTITRENYYLFNIFNTLYEELLDYQLLSDNKEYKLAEGNTVNRYSDEDNVDEASMLQMCKENGDTIKIVFKKNKNNNYDVIIKSFGSKYNSANEAFIEMYNVLAYQNPQVNMEKSVNKQQRIRKR